MTLQVYPREQYLGETVQVWVRVVGTAAVSAIDIDFGNGHVVAGTQLKSWNCSAQSKEAGASAWYVYPAPGQYRITARVAVVPCEILPGPPGGWLNPDGTPAADMPSPWRTTAGAVKERSTNRQVAAAEQAATVPPRDARKWDAGPAPRLSHGCACARRRCVAAVLAREGQFLRN